MVIPKSNHKITQIFTRKQKINYRPRLTQINTDKMKRAMPLKIALPASPTKRKKSV